VARNVEALRAPDAIKIVADHRRLEILRLLMAAPATLTQLGRRLKRSPAWIRHHLVILERHGLVQPHAARRVGRTTEKYYRATAGALRLEQIVMPKTRLPVVLFSGSHDPALETVAQGLESRLLVLTQYVGSLNGLSDLRNGMCQIAGIHLVDDSGDYNRPFVRHFFPERHVELITLAHRTQGLMVAPGNPLGIRRVGDLARGGTRFVNRNQGSGTRVWLDHELQNQGADPASIRGYDRQVATHTQAAEYVRSGRADAALGLQAAARQAGLGFVPLFEERYDVVLSVSAEKSLSPFLEDIQTATFRSRAAALTGYDTAHSGELIRI